MECIRKVGFLLCVITLIALQGCVRNDLEDCPPSVRYALSFEYLLHTTDADGDGIYGGKGDNLFVEDVDKLHIYVFDSNSLLPDGSSNPNYGKCIYADTTLTGPFTEGYIYPLPLNQGAYDIIVWGWGRNTGSRDLKRSTCIIPDPIEPGKTSINEARLILNELNDNVRDIYGKIEKTFYGEIANNIIPPFVSKVDTVDLMNISKLIRIIIPDIETDPYTFPNWRDDLNITIKGDNGAYLFKSTAGGPSIDPVLGRVTDNPHQRFFSDSILEKDPIHSVSFGNNNHVGLVVDISTLRLVLGNANMKVAFEWKNSKGEDEYFELSLIDLVTRNPNYAWSNNVQRDLDRDDCWEIIFPITNTYLSVATRVMQWQIVKQDVGVGGLLQ
jgi:hypothetical protein